MKKKQVPVRSAVVAFGFGVPYSIASNIIIARIASEKARALGEPGKPVAVFTQQDVQLPSDIPVFYTQETPGDPPPTLRIVRELVIWMLWNGVNEIWIVAAEPHLWRCVRDLERVLRATKAFDVQINFGVCKEIYKEPKGVWYCSDSTQKRTVSKWEWFWKYDIVLQVMPWWIYKRIAS